MSFSETGSEASSQYQLKRSIGFWALAIYGIGDILGAGIYALIGQVAGDAGLWSPLSFLISMTVAGLTGITYAELVARYPRSGGEATFVLVAFQRPKLAFLVGWMVLSAGLVSMATVAHAFANYTVALTEMFPYWSLWIGFLLAISAINFWGIRQSSMVNIIFSVTEASGLLFVFGAGLYYFFQNGITDAVASQPATFDGFGVCSAAAIAFFAYIGFQDMVNIAEEVKEPERAFPKAIATAVILCGTIYFLISVVTLVVLPVDELAASKAPLLAVVQKAVPGFPAWIFTLVALIAVSNTGLLNGIMSSRLVYGMSRQKLLPGFLNSVHTTTHTPSRAILFVLVLSIALVLSGTLRHLAQTTSLLLLIVFASVDAAALGLRYRDHQKDDTRPWRVPAVIPVLALISSCGLAANVSPEAMWTTAIVVVIGLILSFSAKGEMHEVSEVAPLRDTEAGSPSSQE